MSAKHPIVVITGSSGAGTTSVTRTFQHIFLREQISATIVEGDSFHRYDREQMKAATADADREGNHHFCYFSPEANLLEDLLLAHAALGRPLDEIPSEIKGALREIPSPAEHEALRLGHRVTERRMSVSEPPLAARRTRASTRGKIVSPSVRKRAKSDLRSAVESSRLCA